MLKPFLFLFLCIFLSSSFALEIDMGDEDDPVAYGRLDLAMSSTFKLYVDGGTGSSQTSTYNIYMPFKSSGGSQDSYHHLIQSSIPGKNIVNQTQAGIVFDLEIDNDGKDELDIYVAVDDGSGNFSIVNNMGNTGSSLTAFMPMADLCDGTLDSGWNDCDDLDAGDDKEEEAQFFIFLEDPDEKFGDDGDEIGESVDPENYSHGMYVKIFLSSRIANYGGAALLKNVSFRRGDSSAYMTFSGDDNSNDSISRIALYTGTSFADLFRTYDIKDEDGEIFFRGLTNNQTYNFTAVYLDKYGFVVDNAGFALDGVATGSVTPVEIDTILEENACYLVTAGFGRDHYILDYFRLIRDNYLLTNYLGKQFVDFYYSTAPKYAKFIYESTYLSGLVRAMSFLLYGLIKFGYIVIPVLILLALSLKRLIWQRKYS